MGIRFSSKTLKNYLMKFTYTEWKRNKYHPFNSRRGRLKGPKKCIYSMGSKLDCFLRKMCFLFSFVHVILLISLEIMRKIYISRFI